MNRNMHNSMDHQAQGTTIGLCKNGTLWEFDSSQGYWRFKYTCYYFTFERVCPTCLYDEIIQWGHFNSFPPLYVNYMFTLTYITLQN